MTSRTTKQAARAYQKAHGVPYAEALRVVMGGDHPSEEEHPSSKGSPAEDAAEWDFDAEVPHAKVTGPGVKTIDLRASGTTHPDPFQVGKSPDGEYVDVDRGEGTFAMGTRSGKAVDSQKVGGAQSLNPFYTPMEPPTAQVLATAGPGRDGKPVDPRRFSIPLGVTEVDHGLTPDGAPGRLPVEWVPVATVEQSRVPALGVYGPAKVGKSAFLAAIADDLAGRAPVLVVTSEPWRYPAPREGLQLFASDGPDTGLARATEQVLAAAQELAADHPSDAMPVVVFDVNEVDSSSESQPLGWLLRVCRSQRVAVLFAGARSVASRHHWAGMSDVSVVLNVPADQNPPPPEMLDRDDPESFPGNWVQKRDHLPIPLTPTTRGSTPRRG